MGTITCRILGDVSVWIDNALAVILRIVEVNGNDLGQSVALLFPEVRVVCGSFFIFIPRARVLVVVVLSANQILHYAFFKFDFHTFIRVRCVASNRGIVAAT